MPVRLRNTRGKNFGASELSGPNPSQKLARANLLSSSPEIFNGNRIDPPSMPINDVSKSMGVNKMIQPIPMRKLKRMK